PHRARRRRPRGRRRLLHPARGDRARAARPCAAQPARGRARLAPGDAVNRAVLVAIMLAAAPAHAQSLDAAPANVDYDPQSTAWNGMASFVGLAEGMGFEVSSVGALEWCDLSSDDILFLIY